MGLSKNGKQMGRPPVENPKPFKICIRLDVQTHDELELYCDKFDVSFTDAVTKAINELAERNGIKASDAPWSQESIKKIRS